MQAVGPVKDTSSPFLNMFLPSHLSSIQQQAVPANEKRVEQTVQHTLVAMSRALVTELAEAKEELRLAKAAEKRNGDAAQRYIRRLGWVHRELGKVRQSSVQLRESMERYGETVREHSSVLYVYKYCEYTRALLIRIYMRWSDADANTSANPRYILGCGHVTCAECLDTLVNTAYTQGTPPSCPGCRMQLQPNPGAKIRVLDGIIEEWVTQELASPGGWTDHQDWLTRKAYRPSEPRPAIAARVWLDDDDDDWEN